MGRDSRRKMERRTVQALTPKQAIDADRPTAEPWNTRYLEYARAQGTPDPATMMRRDENRFPGGKMAGFILWLGGRWEAWRELKQLPRETPLAQTHHDEFDAWLKGWVDEQTSVIIKPLPRQIVRP